MEFLGIGPLELVFILLIAFTVLGPKDIAKTGRTIGRFLRKVVTSQWWSGFRQTSREIRQLPITLMREASIEDTLNEINEINSPGNSILQTINSGDRTGFKGWTNPVFTDRDELINPRRVDRKTIPKETQIDPPDG